MLLERTQRARSLRPPDTWTLHFSGPAGEWAEAITMPLCPPQAELGHAGAVEKDGTRRAQSKTLLLGLCHSNGRKNLTPLAAKEMI